MNRRNFLSWVGIGALTAAVPAPVRALAKACTPAPVLRCLTPIVVDLMGGGDARTIQEGLDLLGNRRGVVLVKCGKYRISSAIKVRGNVSIRGVGGPVIEMGKNAGAAFEVTGARCSLSNFSVKGHPASTKRSSFLKLVP